MLVSKHIGLMAMHAMCRSLRVCLVTNLNVCAKPAKSHCQGIQLALTSIS